MLPAAQRLRRPEHFRAALRGRVDGVRLPSARGGGRLMVLHLVVRTDEATRPGRIGFVVSRAVGNAVVRNRTQRRLRHLMRDRLSMVPDGADLVIRVQPPAAQADSAELGAELDRLLERCLSGVTARSQA